MALAASNTNSVAPKSLSEIFVPIQQEVADFERYMFSLLDSQVPFVRSVAEYILSNGGKRLRPILTVLCAKMSGHMSESVHRMGSCIEFIHTASLLHDDVIDNAKVRRGRASANAKWGNHVSVLVGDFFYCRASQLLTEQGNLRILKIVTDCITALTEGEVLEIVTNSENRTTREDYLSIIKNKTALLFAAACQVGGALAGVSEELEFALRDYGYNLGMAFQLADDVLDYTSSEDVFGKASGIDLQEGKLTLPLIVALESATAEEAQLIRSSLVSERVEKDAFQAILQVIHRYRGFEKTYDLARDYIETAKRSLTPYRSSFEKDILLTIADFVVSRNW